MTREDIKTITDIVHKTIYQFFDGDDEEAPMSDKDELLLEVNKAICNNLKALEQEPSGDAISRQAVLKLFATHDGKYLFEAIRDLPSVTPKQRTGHWIEYTKVIIPEPYNHWKQAWECSECGYGGQDCEDETWLEWKYCPQCGAKMESEEQA